MLGFSGLFRPGELSHILRRDIVFSFGSGVGATYACTTVCQAKNRRALAPSQVIVVHDLTVVAWLFYLACAIPGDAAMFPFSQGYVAKSFRYACLSLGIDYLTLSCLRAVGATTQLNQQGITSKPMLGGRWSFEGTLKHYMRPPPGVGVSCLSWKRISLSHRIGFGHSVQS